MHLHRGQTIIELLIAFSVIVVGLFAAATLTFSNLNTVDRDLDEVVVINIAREGIELTKQIRDSNWLAGRAFDEGLVDKASGNLTATPVWDGIRLAPSFDFAAKDFTDANTTIVRMNAPEAPSFFANSNAAASIVGSDTPFKRLLAFYPICEDMIARKTGTCGTLKKSGIRVESRIQWSRKGSVKNFVLYEDLYDWK